MNIFLIGFMGSGKSAVGRKLALRMGYGFIDMDDLIEKQEGASVREIFRNKGEKEFRKMERKTLEALLRQDKLVIATGGGVPCEAGNMDLINKYGISIYLKMDPSALYDRLKTRQSNRPLIKDLSEAELKEFIIEKLSDRESYYRQAKFTVDGTQRDVDGILALLTS